MCSWLQANADADDAQEASHLATMLATHGYIIPVEGHQLAVRNDSFLLSISNSMSMARGNATVWSVESWKVRRGSGSCTDRPGHREQHRAGHAQALPAKRPKKPSQRPAKFSHTERPDQPVEACESDMHADKLRAALARL
uniref:DEP domain-containing protein n=1 Tax=Macrostomum lignano TaxID=282301 RepID=A0A1I8F9B2_9PLAT